MTTMQERAAKVAETPKIYRGFRYKLAPTDDQAGRLTQFSGVCRLIYNLAWEQRHLFWRQYNRATGRHITFQSQGTELTQLRAEYDWIAAVERGCQDFVLIDLARAFDNFFRGIAKYPTPRARGRNDNFRFNGRDISVRRLNAKWSEARLPKIGWVKFRDTRPMRGTLKNATISRDAAGWNISFGCEIEHKAIASTLPSVGIDRGISNTLALSTGEMFSLPDMTALDRRKRKAQRAASRKKRGSVRHAKALRRASKLSSKIARIRSDWHHKAALNLSNRFGSITLEDLKIRNMTAGGTRKHGLNRSILNQGWTAFATILAYKLEERGGALVKVPAAYTSQTCSECGVVDAKSRESQAVFVCRHCGFTAHADHNAALNILRGNTPVMRVEGCRQAPDETRTIPNQTAKAA